MRGPPVVLTNTLGRPVTNIISERGAVPMVVVNTLGEPVTLVSSGGEPVTLFNPNGTLWDYPFSLFANNEQGAWYDPSDYSTLFQNSTGTTPVTAVEQPVGLMLDRSGRGNHATQATSASRPVLRARYNLLTYSEQFDNAAWTKNASSVTANAGVAPDGTTTADKLVENSATDFHSVRPTTSVGTIGATETLSVYAKAAERSWFVLQLGSNKTAYFNLSAGTIGTTASGTTATITALANGWYRCSIAGERVATQGNQIILASADNTASYTGDGTSGILIWGAQLLTAADQTSTGGAYQRIAAATDYDVSNPVWRPYLAFDGTDDWMPTQPALDLSTDWTHVGGWQKTVAGGTFPFGLSAGSFAGIYSDNNAIWYVYDDASTLRVITPTNTSLNTSYVYSVESAAGGAHANVIGRVNGVNGTSRQQYNDTADAQGLALFTRVNTAFSSGMGGRFYGGVWVKRALTGSELTATEQWMAGKTGVTL